MYGDVIIWTCIFLFIFFFFCCTVPFGITVISFMCRNIFDRENFLDYIIRNIYVIVKVFIYL